MLKNIKLKKYKQGNNGTTGPRGEKGERGEKGYISIKALDGKEIFQGEPVGNFSSFFLTNRNENHQNQSNIYISIYVFFFLHISFKRVLKAIPEKKVLKEQQVKLVFQVKFLSFSFLLNKILFCYYLFIFFLQ